MKGFRIMKRLIAMTAAAVLLAGTALAQPYQQQGHGPPPPGHGGPPPREQPHGPPPGHGGYDHGPPPREVHDWH
jgi:AT-rich interactive domain-containing protein 1